MKIRLTHQLPPQKDNPRNSEGAFLRGKNGEILFAYSRYHGDSSHDHATCNIALIVSHDEGESWSEPRLIARAAEFGTDNIMSVSAVEQKNGDLAFYFLIKENDLNATLGRVISSDGVNWTSERCICNCPKAYYVVNNDRIVRLSDGRLLAPTAFCTNEEIFLHGSRHMSATILVSEDDGASFFLSEQTFRLPNPGDWARGYEEPGIIEYNDRLYYWIRTYLGRQYETESREGINGFFDPRPSEFTSPNSPMQIKSFDGVAYALYNPVPRYDGRVELEGSWGRTPFVLRKSLDDGKTWGTLNVIEDDPARGYCYPAVFKTRDNCLLLGYCRGNAEDGNTLCRLGIAKIEIESIE
ncbi:MAG: exo-alpha-sialidase [Ruminococcaceae bacterium]|nr:exo-alpha-sialidase [Oscillospiraceae bacterium]